MNSESSDLTPEDRDALRELASGATPGPWEAEYSGEQGNCVLPPDARSTREAVAVTRLYHQQADAAFIAAARTAVPALLDMLGQAEQRIRDLTQEARDERAACLDQIEQVQIRDARIKAVEDVLDRVRKHLTAWVDEYGHEVYQGNGWAEGVRDAAREALKDLDGEQ